MSVVVGSKLTVSEDEKPEDAAHGENTLVKLIRLPNYPLYVDGKLDSAKPDNVPADKYGAKGEAIFSSVTRAFEIQLTLTQDPKTGELVQERALFEKPINGCTFPYTVASLYRGADRTRMLDELAKLTKIPYKGGSKAPNACSLP